MYGVKPLAIKLGLRGRSKLERFMEQGYALFYFVGSSSIGLVSATFRSVLLEILVTNTCSMFFQYVMAGQKTWWYQTEHYWIGYPHWYVTMTFVTLQSPAYTFFLAQEDDRSSEILLSSSIRVLVSTNARSCPEVNNPLIRLDCSSRDAWREQNRETSK